MTFASLKKVNIRILSLTLSVAVLITSFIGMNFNFGVFATDSNLISFTDNFERSTITGNNSGWIEQIEGAQGSVIDDGVLMLTEGGTNTGHYSNLIMRPMSEAAVNQKVSVEVNNLADHFVSSHTVASANVHVRVQSTNSKYATSYYAAAQDSFLKIGKTVSADGNTEPEKTIIVQKTDLDLRTGRIYKIELTAEGTNPTTLTATLYNVTDNTVIATITGTDSTAALQKDGTVGLSVTNNNSNNKRTARMDNFCYNELSNENDNNISAGTNSYMDDFERNTITGNNSGWVEQIAGAQGSKIESGVLKLTEGGTNTGHYSNLIMRPMSESATNQKVSVNVNNLADHFVSSHTVASANVHVRVQSTNSKYATSYYAAAQDSFLKIGKTVSVDGNTEPEKTIIVQKTDLNLATGKTYKIELTAEGVYPTTLTATLYNVTDNVEIATITGTDSTPALQNAGTVGLSVTNNHSSNKRTAAMDNFVYNELNQVSFGDDFSRDTITGNDSGWVEQIAGAQGSKIESGVLKLTEGGTNTGHYSNLIMRPMSESATNQKVSVNINNLADHFVSSHTVASANVHVRVQSTNSKYATSYYAAVQDSFLKIGKTVSADGNTEPTKAIIVQKTDLDLRTGRTYKLELTAEGVYPTTLTATLYNVTDNEVVATITGTDSTPALQNAGTVGLSVTNNHSSNKRTAAMDTFAYNELKNVSFGDDFERNIITANGWIEQIEGAQGSKIESGVLKLTEGGTNTGHYSNLIMRPMSESATNQKVSVNINNLADHFVSSHTVASANVHVRVQSTNSKYATSYYAAAQDSFLKIGKTVSADGNTEPTKAIIVQKTDLDLRTGRTYKLELTAEGTNPTTLTATLYNVTDNTVIATITGTDSTEALQNAGTVGLSVTNNHSSNKRTAAMDTFAYNELVDNLSDDNNGNNGGDDDDDDDDVIIDTPYEVPYSYTDDFNRDTISGNDSGWIEKQTGTDTDNKIVDGVLNLTEDKDSNGNYGYISDLIMRPMSEAALNQKVSVEITNRGELANFASGNVHVRVVPTSYGYTGYMASLNNGILQIRRTTGTGTVVLTGGEIRANANFVSGHTYRLELVAQGVYPTTLQATVYDVTDNNNVVVSVVGTDNTTELQVSGTVALSAASNNVSPRNVAKMDNFIYTQTDMLKYSDGFGTNTLDSSWVMSDDAKAAPTVEGGTLKLGRTSIGNFSGKAIIRPIATESALKQLIEIDFTRTDSEAHTFGPSVLTRVQDANNLQYTGNYYQVVVELAKGGKNNSAARIQIIKSGASNLTSGNKPSVTFNTDPTLKYRLQVSVTSNEERTSTTIVATLYKVNPNGTLTKTAQVTGTDTTAALQNAGTTALTYLNGIEATTLNSGFAIDNFGYFEQLDKPQVPLSPDPEVPFVFEDDFDREDKDINSDNGWIDQNAVISGGAIGAVKDNKLVLHNAYDFAEGSMKGRILRPLSEATLDQRVSVDVLNLGEIESAELSLRVSGIPATDNEISKRAFYTVKLSKTQLTIHARISWYAGRFAGAEFKYQEGHIYRIEATAQGSLSTVITATVYDVTDNNKIVATATGTDESLNCTNDGRTAQMAGTVGLAYCGTEPAVFDNFKYEQLGTAKNYDIFNRKDGAVENDWVSSSANSVIAAEKLIMSNDGTDNMWNALMLRPETEKALNQSVKVVFNNEGMPQGTGPAPVLFARVKNNNTGGYICYYAKITYKGADTTVSIYKVLENGESVLLKEEKPLNNMHTNFGNSTQPIHFEFRAEGSSPTKLTVVLYKLNDGVGETYYYTGTVYDNQPELQDAGTAGVSYTGSTGSFAIDTFSYFDVEALPQQPDCTEEKTEPQMIYFHGTVKSGNFGQWVELEPNKEYVYKVRFKPTFDSGGFAPKLRYEIKMEGRVMRDFAATTTLQDENTFYYTLTFTVPEDAHIQQNGKARIFVGIHEGGLSSTGYATDFSLVEKGYTSNTNLLVNADFKKGLYGWCAPHSVYAQGVYSSEFVSLMPESEEVEVMTYNPLVFMRDDSDIYFDDGDWSGQATNGDAGEAVLTGTIKGQLLDIDGKPIKNAKLMLTPGSITIKTDKNGNFEFNNVEVGTYQLVLALKDGTNVSYDYDIYVNENSIITLELTYAQDVLDSEDNSQTDNSENNNSEDNAQNNNSNSNSGNLSDYFIYIIIAAGVVVVLSAAIVIFVLMKKRKQ